MAKQNKHHKFIAVSATAALVASAIVPVASAASFSDQNQIADWAKDYVEYVDEWREERIVEVRVVAYYRLRYVLAYEDDDNGRDYGLRQCVLDAEASQQ